MAEPIRNPDELTPTTSGRLPIGLTLAMLAAACSLAGTLLLCNLGWPARHPFELTVHASAGLCLAWGVVAHIVARFRPRMPESLAQDALAVLNVMQIVLALIVGIVMLYVATTAVLTRIPSLPFFSFRPAWQVYVWPSGTLDLALVAIAALLAWWRTGSGGIMTGMMWLLVLMSLWSALRIPAAITVEENGISHTILVDWVSPFVFGTAVTLAAFTLLSGMLGHRRRVEAWPDHLDDLLTAGPDWPGFRYSAGIIAVIVLALGCVFIVSPATPFAALLAGVSVLALTNRHWNENYADAGLGLITLSIISFLMIGVPDIRGNKPEYFAAVFGRALLGLAITTAFWHWLAGVWDQQLDNGRAWTTAGRLIRPCRRLGFLLGAIGVLVSIQLAFWPKLPNVYIKDDSLGRWLWGVLPNLILLSALMRSARHTQKSTLAWLAMCAFVSLTGFIIIRSAGSFIYTGFLEYWPLILALAAGVLAVAAYGASRSAAWKPFHEPTYVLAVLVAPILAISGASVIGSRAIPPWVATATFGTLACTYLLTALLPGPRRFIVLTFVCAAAAVYTLCG